MVVGFGRLVVLASCAVTALQAVNRIVLISVDYSPSRFVTGALLGARVGPINANLALSDLAHCAL